MGDPMDSRLRDFELQTPSPRVMKAIHAAWRKSGMPLPETEAPRRYPWLAAAAVLLGLAVAGYAAFRWRTAPPPTPPAMAMESSNTFLLIHTVGAGTDSPSALIQEMRDFRIVRRYKGDRIYEYRIERIEADGLGLSDGKTSTFVTSADLRQSFEKAVTNDVARIREVAASGALNDDDFERLATFANLNCKPAIHLLRDMLDDGNAIAARAAEVLGGARTLSQVGRLVDQAADAKNPYRLKAIEGLGHVMNPVAMAALGDIALNATEPEDCRLAALQTITGSPDAGALHLVQRVIDSSDCPKSLKDRAVALRSTLESRLLPDSGETQ